MTEERASREELADALEEAAAASLILETETATGDPAPERDFR